MVEDRVLLLKQRAHLLCDYIRAEDRTRETVEELEDDAIVQQMVRLVGARVMVATECTVVAFLVNCCPNLVSHPSLCFSLCLWSTFVG